MHEGSGRVGYVGLLERRDEHRSGACVGFMEPGPKERLPLSLLSSSLTHVFMIRYTAGIYRVVCRAFRERLSVVELGISHGCNGKFREEDKSDPNLRADVLVHLCNEIHGLTLRASLRSKQLPAISISVYVVESGHRDST